MKSSINMVTRPVWLKRGAILGRMVWLTDGVGRGEWDGDGDPPDGWAERVGECVNPFFIAVGLALGLALNAVALAVGTVLFEAEISAEGEAGAAHTLHTTSPTRTQ